MLFHCCVITHYSIISDCYLLLTLFSNSNGRPLSQVHSFQLHEVLHPIIHVSIWLAVSNMEAIQTFASIQLTHSSAVDPTQFYLHSVHLCEFNLQSVFDFSLQNLLWRLLALPFLPDCQKITGKRQCKYKIHIHVHKGNNFFDRFFFLLRWTKI